MKRFWYYSLLVAIALFVASMALLWRDNTASEDSDQLTTWAGSVFLVFVVCGPGLLAKQVFALLVPVEEHAKNRRRLLREIKKAESVRTMALTEIRGIQNWHYWWQQEAKRMRAVYLLHYRDAGGTIPSDLLTVALEDVNINRELPNRAKAIPAVPLPTSAGHANTTDEVPTPRPRLAPSRLDGEVENPYRRPS